MKYTYTDLLHSLGIGGAHPGSLHLTKEILSNHTITEKTSVLDIGCGTGQTVAYIANKYDCSITGLDHHSGMVKKAKKRLEHKGATATIMQGEAEALSFPNNTFDYVLSESVTAFTDVSRSLHEYYRVLQTNGKLIMTELTQHATLQPEEKDELISFYSFSTIWTETNWIEAMQEAGFSNITVQHPSISNVPSMEFDPYTTIDEPTFDWLSKHQQLTEKYNQKIDARIYVGQKN